MIEFPITDTQEPYQLINSPLQETVARKVIGGKGVLLAMLFLPAVFFSSSSLVSRRHMVEDEKMRNNTGIGRVISTYSGERRTFGEQNLKTVTK